jgi:hypothetical protein
MRYAVAIALAVSFATPVWAQQVEIEKPAPPTAPAREPERDVIPPGLYDETRPSDADHYPRGGQVQHDPAFFGPLSSRRETPTSSGRMGIAGWVSPNTPIGATFGTGWKEVSGYFALGFSATWDGPAPARRSAPSP